MFWEKDWGSIGQKTYCEHIVNFPFLFRREKLIILQIPLIHDYTILHPELRLMQDNAPDHRAKATGLELDRRGVKKIFWPPYFPDLNPIEHVWDLMKDWI